MTYEIKGGNFPIVEFVLNKGEKVVCQAGAVCWIDPTLEMETKVNGGVGKMVGRMFTGERAFQNIYTAITDNAKLSLGSSFPGMIKAIRVTPGQSLICQKSSFLGYCGNIEMSVFFNKKLRVGLFGGEGFLMQKLSGDGIVFIEIDGSEFEYDLGRDEQLILSTGYLVSLSETCSLDVKTVKGVGNVFFGGEGLFNVVVKGPGKVTAQSMPIQQLASSIDPYIIKTTSSGSGE